jgi:glycosyltransferase involved in cell wall biosynthesis
MRIAQVAPLCESVPPRLYGGTERVVSYLTEELVRQGHDVTLFASGDSVTSARLVPVGDEALRLSAHCVDPVVRHLLMIEKIAEMARQFDIIHFHIDYLHFPISRRCEYRHVTTLHGRLDIPDLTPLYREFAEVPLASISNAQRAPLPFANWQGTVYHGLPSEHFRFHTRCGQYLAFVGRISPEKRLDRAIKIAQRAGLPLKIAAKLDDADREYYQCEIKPLLQQPHVEFIGEIDESQKNDFLGNALALLFPIDWPEPFGLVMIESMACGTPVIAFHGGAVDEIMVQGRSGFVCSSIDEAVDAVRKVERLDRAECRRLFEERYTAERMARDYVRLYQKMLSTANSHARNYPGQRPILGSGRIASA